MVHVAKIITIVPLRISSESSLISEPASVTPKIRLYAMVTAASVAAACALLKPKIIEPSSGLIL